MGNKLVVLSLVGVALWANTVQISQIDQLIEEIKKKRLGLSKTEIARLRDPFISEKIFQDKNETNATASSGQSKKNRLVLTSIFNNMARINGKWYRLNSKVGPYVLTKIADNYVVLRYKRKYIRLYLNGEKSKKSLFIIKSR
ncbi:MAG: hypothetical protein GXO16_05405 [Epsilonproteobacteria bacterium]|nr:hypothetical protein [Campylobacterota bacterium]